MWWVPTPKALCWEAYGRSTPYPLSHCLPSYPAQATEAPTASAQPVPTSGAQGYLHRGQHSHQRPCVPVPTQLLQHLVGFEMDPCEQVWAATCFLPIPLVGSRMSPAPFNKQVISHVCENKHDLLYGHWASMGKN